MSNEIRFSGRTDDPFPGQDVKIVRVKGNRNAEREIRKYLEQGYEFADHNVRKAVWSPVTGLFTRSQIHTITFRK